MKSRFLSITAIVIALLMLLASCSDGGNDSPEPVQTVKIQSDSDEKQFVSFDNPEVDSYIDDLSSECDFNGRTFTWCGNEGQAPEREEETGDIRNDSL